MTDDIALSAPASTSASIGSARMTADGTIILTLRADDAGGMMGDSQISYASDSPDYAKVRDHIGPSLKPGGEEVPVAPFD